MIDNITEQLRNSRFFIGMGIMLTILAVLADAASGGYFMESVITGLMFFVRLIALDVIHYIVAIPVVLFIVQLVMFNKKESTLLVTGIYICSMFLFTAVMIPILVSIVFSWYQNSIVTIPMVLGFAGLLFMGVGVGLNNASSILLYIVGKNEKKNVIKQMQKEKRARQQAERDREWKDEKVATVEESVNPAIAEEEPEREPTFSREDNALVVEETSSDVTGNDPDDSNAI